MDNDCLIGYLPKKTKTFPILTFIFLQACNSKICLLEITGKTTNQRDEK